MTPLPPSQQVPAVHELLLEVLASAQDRDLMLRALQQQQVFVRGRVGASMQEGLPGAVARAVPSLLLDEPALRLTVRCVIGSSPDDVGRTASLSASFVASELHAPSIVLCPRRPGGWPA